MSVTLYSKFDNSQKVAKYFWRPSHNYYKTGLFSALNTIDPELYACGVLYFDGDMQYVVTGSVETFETSVMGAQRELTEELGLFVDLDHFRFVGEYQLKKPYVRDIVSVATFVVNATNCTPYFCKSCVLQRDTQFPKRQQNTLRKCQVLIIGTQSDLHDLAIQQREYKSAKDTHKIKGFGIYKISDWIPRMNKEYYCWTHKYDKTLDDVLDTDVLETGV